MHPKRFGGRTFPASGLALVPRLPKANPAGQCRDKPLSYITVTCHPQPVFDNVSIKARMLEMCHPTPCRVRD